MRHALVSCGHLHGSISVCICPRWRETALGEAVVCPLSFFGSTGVQGSMRFASARDAQECTGPSRVVSGEVLSEL